MAASSSAKKSTKSTAKTATKSKKAATASSDDDVSEVSSGKTLVIVESPAKAKTLKKILGDKFLIKASVGHIRDLPTKKLGVDVDKNFEPVYEVLDNKADIVDELRQTAKKCSQVYLAADPDREGEAIAWHLATLLQDDIPKERIKRIEFHEITKGAILEAIEHPRDINAPRVDAQQARRVLDRLVGYKLSPLLWKKVTKGLSAGRVQSVSVRLICDREAEIDAFVPEEYWTLEADLLIPKTSGSAKANLLAALAKVNGEKPEIGSQQAMDELLSKLEKATFTVAGVNERESRRNPVAPFITSTLQREASTRYGYPVKRTMQIAQQLYEGIDLGKEGPVGLITYMRTDSTRISDEAQAEAKDFIIDQFGKEYYPDTPRVYTKKGKNAQDAHEAIRPTSVLHTPKSLKAVLKDEQYRVYELIWNRFVASQMESAKIKTKTIEISADNCLFRTSHSKVTFPGYMAVYQSSEEDDNPEAQDSKALPDLKKGETLTMQKLLPKQHFTEPPPRFNEASLVKTMEELGIGRPSTYAATITTVQDRGYVRKEEKALIPTELGKVVNKLLMEHFTDIVDVNFTAHMENRLDEIAESGIQWQKVVGDFYGPFEATLKKATSEMGKVLVIIDNEMCELCGKPMSLKTSRWGSQFLGCTGYPECKGTRPLTKDQKAAPEDRPTDEKCDKCNGEMVIRYGRFGDYLACKDDECKGKRPLIIKTGVNCPQCGTGDIVQRKSGRGKIFFGCNGYPKCVFAVWNKPTGGKCPDCSSLLVEKVLKKGTFHACSSKECKYTEQVADAAPAS